MRKYASKQGKSWTPKNIYKKYSSLYKKQYPTPSPQELSFKLGTIYNQIASLIPLLPDQEQDHYNKSIQQELSEYNNSHYHLVNNPNPQESLQPLSYWINTLPNPYNQILLQFISKDYQYKSFEKKYFIHILGAFNLDNFPESSFFKCLYVAIKNNEPLPPIPKELLDLVKTNEIIENESH